MERGEGDERESMGKGNCKIIDSDGGELVHDVAEDFNVFVFFFKQKTAYEFMPSLVGSGGLGFGPMWVLRAIFDQHVQNFIKNLARVASGPASAS